MVGVGWAGVVRNMIHWMEEYFDTLDLDGRYTMAFGARVVWVREVFVRL